MKKFLSIVLMILLVATPVVTVNAATTTTKTTTKVSTTKKTTAKKTSTTKKTSSTKKTSATKKTSSTKTSATKTTTTAKEETNKDAINVYVFYSDTCGYCKALHEFLDELKKDETYGKMFKVVDYEVGETANAKLYKRVAKYLKAKYDGSVPFYVIGSQPFNGYNQEDNDTIKKAIKSAYESDEYEDEVKKVIDGADKDKNITGYVILGIVAVVIVAVIVSSSKSTQYEDSKEEKSEDDKKTSSTTKKTTTKNSSKSTK